MSAGNGEAKNRVLLGMPGYGQLTAGAARGFFRPSRDPSRDVACRMENSSLLASNFNRLWCWALNEDRKAKVAYFAMIHADVEPEEFWLDKLIDELESKQLDVLGVVAPIKDTRGVTSTALARDDGSTWRVHSRLTMDEVYRLPETFTGGDVGRPLLLNTGLWACKFDAAWARKCFFTINDRIIVNPEGNYVPEVEPEDWFFSRLLHELGLKVGCTRKVELGHRGDMVFGNTKPWGDNKFDREYLESSCLPDAAGDDWFPHNAAGWLTVEEGAELARLAAGKDVLEIGSYCGRSTVCLARDAKSVYAVDTFDGRGTALPGDTLKAFKRNVERFGVKDRVFPVRGESAEVVPDLPAVFDLAFIDGSHDRASVLRDAELATERLRPGGLLCFHDYENVDHEVTAAVNELISGGAELVRRAGSLAVLRPAPAATLQTLEV